MVGVLDGVTWLLAGFLGPAGFVKVSATTAPGPWGLQATDNASQSPLVSSFAAGLPL